MERIYTTNYDDTIEYASKIGEVQRDSIDQRKIMQMYCVKKVQLFISMDT